MSEIVPFSESHIHQARSLWSETEWVAVSDSDESYSLRSFLQRNPGCSWAAINDGRLIGTVLAGHDGRRGYIYHLVVEKNEQRRGLGLSLLQRALTSLQEQGISKCHAIVFSDNPAVEQFWSKNGWQAQETTQFSMLLN